MHSYTASLKIECVMPGKMCRLDTFSVNIVTAVNIVPKLLASRYYYLD